jgi:multiple sugar transport system substrate-binding protein
VSLPLPDVWRWLPWNTDDNLNAMPPPTVNVLSWSGGEAENRVIQASITAFEQANPDVLVTGLLTPDYATALADALGEETPPDLFVVWSHQLPDLVAVGAILPVPNAYDTAASLPTSLRAAVQVAGQSYCIPRDFNTLALFYNPALFDRVEAPHPQHGWRWADLRSAAEAVTDVDSGIYGLVLSHDASRLLPFLWQGDVDGIPWSGPDAVPAAEFYVNLLVDGVAVEPVALESSWNGEAFGRGRAAMTIEGGWLIPYLAARFPELKYAIVELPAGPTRAATTGFVSCWAVSAAAPSPDAALRLAAHLTTPETNAAWATATGNLPPSHDQATAWLAGNSAYAPFLTAAAHALPWTGPPGFAQEVEEANRVLAAAADQESSLDDLLAQLASLADPFR